jgi:hypothetical protein
MRTPGGGADDDTPTGRTGTTAMTTLPSGTVTFLFTDIEGSTRLWEQHPAAMQAALARHDQLLQAATERHGGRIIKLRGDGVHAVFAAAGEAVQAALAAQHALLAEPWPEAGILRVRMGLHTGEATHSIRCAAGSSRRGLRPCNSTPCGYACSRLAAACVSCSPACACTSPAVIRPRRCGTCWLCLHPFLHNPG